MPRDYAKTSPTKRKPAARGKKPPRASTHRLPGWAWLLAGIFIGMLAESIFRLWDKPVQEFSAVLGELAEAPSAAAQKPRFDFYTLLRESEVIVPDIEQSPLRGTAISDDIFLLQAGSFRNAADADTLRARLILLNLDARVESSGQQPGNIWHRVLVGPYTSRSKLASVRATLLENGIDNLVLKRSKQ